MNAAPRYRYRLNARFDGDTRTFLLESGVFAIGTAAPNQVVMNARGVSRRHARLHLPADDRPMIEDLQSKNGIFVDGRRVSRHPLEPGVEVTLGEARLTLEPISGDDAHLAIAWPPASRAPSAVSRGAPAAQGSTMAAADHHLAIIERMAIALHPPVGAVAFGNALAALLAPLDATAAWVRLLPNRPPEVLALRGPAGCRLGEQLAALPGPDGLTPDASGVAIVTHGAMQWLVVSRAPHGHLALVIDDRQPLAEAMPLLRAGLRLLANACDLPSATDAPDPGDTWTDRLRFPPGHVRARSPAMTSLYRQLAQVADLALPVLVLGETGVGKEGVAQTLHASSDRHRGPLVTLNCAAMPADLLEAEMFGIGRAVATGVAPRRGRLEAADGGTLFLDEVGEMSTAFQAKLLRALQEKEVQPVGGGGTRPIDVRLVAATNQNLRQRVEAGHFRRDLYYRLAGVVLEVPALRHRPEDLPALIETLLARAATQNGKAIRGLTAGALHALLAHPWPGNVRELAHTMTLLAGRCPSGHAIDSDMVPDTIRVAMPSRGRAPFALAPQLESLEQRLIARAMDHAGNQKEAARLLGIARNTLRAKLRRGQKTSPARNP